MRGCWSSSRRARLEELRDWARAIGRLTTLSIWRRRVNRPATLALACLFAGAHILPTMLAFLASPLSLPLRPASALCATPFSIWTRSTRVHICTEERTAAVSLRGVGHPAVAVGCLQHGNAGQAKLAYMFRWVAKARLGGTKNGVRREAGITAEEEPSSSEDASSSALKLSWARAVSSRTSVIGTSTLSFRPPPSFFLPSRFRDSHEAPRARIETWPRSCDAVCAPAEGITPCTKTVVAERAVGEDGAPGTYDAWPCPDDSPRESFEKPTTDSIIDAEAALVMRASRIRRLSSCITPSTSPVSRSLTRISTKRLSNYKESVQHECIFTKFLGGEAARGTRESVQSRVLEWVKQRATRCGSAIAGGMRRQRMVQEAYGRLEGNADQRGRQ